jgi:cobalt-zinc-cadmium efflux system outer membrane protein
MGTRTLLSCILIIAGANPGSGAGLEEIESVVKERTGATLGGNQAGGPTEASLAHVDSLLQEELTVDRAIQVAVLNNRSLHASLHELGIAEAELDQAKLIKNPVVEGEVRYPDEPFEVGVMQDVGDLFLLPLRRRVGSAHLREMQLRTAHTVHDLAAEVRSAFYSFQATLQIRSMRGTIADASRASADLAQRQHAAGNISDLALESTQALYEDAKLELAQSEEDVVVARESLNRLMGIWGSQTSWTVAEHLPELPAAEQPLEGLETLAVGNRLDLLATEEEVLAAEEAVPLARWSQFPSLALGVHVEREPEGERTVGPAIELSLPLFDRGQAASKGAQSRLAQSRERRAALAVEIRSEVRAAFARRAAARRRVEYYRDVVLPRRDRIIAQSQREYNFMLIGVYQLIQAKQDEIEVRRAYIEAQRDYWVAWSELDHAVGGGLR